MQHARDRRMIIYFVHIFCLKHSDIFYLSVRRKETEKNSVSLYVNETLKWVNNLNGYFQSLYGLKMTLVQLSIYHTEQANVANADLHY